MSGYAANQQSRLNAYIQLGRRATTPFCIKYVNIIGNILVEGIER
jgi:hypothetical protein